MPDFVEESFDKLNQAYNNGTIEPLQLTELARCYRYGLGTEKNIYEAFEFYTKAIELGADTLDEFNEFIEQDLKFTSTKFTYNIAKTYEEIAYSKEINPQYIILCIDKAIIIYLKVLINIKADYTAEENDGDISFSKGTVNELIKTKIEIIDKLLQSKNIDWFTKIKLKKIQKELRKLPILDNKSSTELLFTNYKKIKELLAPIASKLESILNRSSTKTDADLIDFYEKAIILGNPDSIKNFLLKLIQLKYKKNIDLQNNSIISKKINEILKIKDLNQRYLALSSFYRDTLKDEKQANQFLLFAAGYGMPLVYSYEFGLDNKTPNIIAKEALKYGNPDAIYQLSQFSKPISGITSGNPHQYLFLLENAAEKGQPDAMVEYGKILLYGIPQTKIIQKFGKDPIRAFKFFSDAAKVGNIDAMIELGICYANGVGIKQNFEQAVNCFLMAIERQKNRNESINTDALTQLGLIWDKISDELKKNTLALLEPFKIFESDDISNITPFNFYEKAYNLDKNNTTATLNLGLCYLNGYNTPQNPELAFVYFKKAAGINNINKNGISNLTPKNTEALLQVGLCYLYGISIEQDEQLGFKIIERAANLGNVNAKYQLVMHYQQNLATVEKTKLNTITEKAKLDQINYNIASLLKDIAYNEQDSNAMFQLGLHYMYMSGISQNQEKKEEEKKEEEKKEEEKKEEEKIKDIKDAENFTFIKEEKTEEEKYRNQAIKTITEAINMGNVNAMVYLANLYYSGLTINQNYKEAFGLYQRAAALGNTDAINSLAIIYETAISDLIEKDDKKVGELYKELASYYDKNLNYDQAFIFFNKAYDLGNKNVVFNLGVHYASNGNFDKAFKLFREAADLNNPYAMYNLAECYEFGNGTQKDINKAIEFYERASKFPKTQKQAQAKLKEISKQQPTTDYKFIENEHNEQDFYSEDDNKSEDDSTEINEKEFISTHSYEEESVENKDSKIEAYSEYDVEKNSRETSKTDLLASKKELKREIKKLKNERNKLIKCIIKEYRLFSFKRRIYPFLHFVHYRCKKKEIIEQYNKTYQKRKQDLETLDKKIEEANKRLRKLELEKKHKSWFKKQKEVSNGRV